MHRRFHKRRWTLTCFLAAMVILPTAAVLQKDNDAQNKSAAHAYAEKEGAAQSVSWNVVSDGYGWEEETAPVAAEISRGTAGTKSLRRCRRKAVSGKLES